MSDGTRKTRRQWFVDARFGMFIHWGLYAIPARGEWVRSPERMSIEKYQVYFDEFNPTRYNPREWAALARRAGMRYAVMTAKHHDGFCLFDSALTDYKATNTPAGRDLFREYVEAFRAEGLKVGVYYSLLDWHHPDYPAADPHHPMRDDAEFCARPRDFSRYIEYFHGQVREIMSNYGRLDVAWFDFSYGDLHGEAWQAKKLVKMIRSLQPDILIDNRLDLHGARDDDDETAGDFDSPEQIIPTDGLKDRQGNPRVWEACVTLNDHWGYARNSNYKSSAQVIRMLAECVSKGGNLLLNVGPNAYGEIPPQSILRLEEIGNWMAQNGESIYGCGNPGLPKQDWGYLTARGDKTLYAHITNRPIGQLPIVGLKRKITKARCLADGSEVGSPPDWLQKPADAQLIACDVPESCDTVIRLELA
jgi:alpha-L-fucosidase